MNETQRKTARGEKRQISYRTENNTMAIVKFFPISNTLDVNELNSPVKRHRGTEWIFKKK